MAYSFSIVECAEVYGTAKENRTLDDWTASVDLRCSWANRHNLMDDIIGNQRPWPYWPYAGGVGLFPRNAAMRADATEYNASGQGMDYEDAVITFNYGVPGKDDQPDPTELYSETLEPTTEFLTEDYNLFKWKSDGSKLKEGEQPGRIIRGLRLVRTIFRLTSLNANILTLPGSCNNASYLSTALGLTFAAETLLFIPPVISRTITTDGAEAWNVRCAWEYKEDGWNKYWRAKTQAYDTITLADGGADYESYTPKAQQPWLP